MKLLSFEMRGVRHLPAMKLSFGDAGDVPPVSLVTGPPASGTSTVLEAIAAAVAQLVSGGATPDGADIVGTGGATAVLRSRWQLDEEERSFAGVTEETTDAEVLYRAAAPGRAEADPGLLGVMSRYSHDPAISKVVLFPARRVTDSLLTLVSDFEAEMRQRHLSSDSDKFAGLSRAVARHAQPPGNRQLFDRAAALFKEMCDSATLYGMGSTGAPDLLRPRGGFCPIHRAAFSERNAFVLAAGPALMGLDNSVILLDTPELGLGAGKARQWMTALSQAMPGAQWIVATRDPELLASVPRQAVTDIGAFQ